LIEKKNVIRHMDATTHNHGNTLGTVYGSSTEPVKPIEEIKTLCDYCKKPVHKFTRQQGTNNGNGQTLRENIIPDIKKHPWYSGEKSLQAHHLICTEAMNDSDWSGFVWEFGYSINHKNNGVMLPYFMELACQLHVPLHRGNHDKGTAGSLPYPDTIKKRLKNIKRRIKAGEHCDNPQTLIDELNDYSKFVLNKLSAFRWTITSDGKDYDKEGNGSAGVCSITQKPKQACLNRNHGIKKYEQITIISRNSKPLEIGK